MRCTARVPRENQSSSAGTSVRGVPFKTLIPSTSTLRMTAKIPDSRISSKSQGSTECECARITKDSRYTLKALSSCNGESATLYNKFASVSPQGTDGGWTKL